MKKKLNIIFFSICFLAAIIAETYCFTILQGDLFSVIGIGLVVLITGYLLLDSIRSKLRQSKDNLRFYLDHAYRDETEKWIERYEEILNLQKASYTAAKKSTAIISEQFNTIINRLETLETKTEKAMLKIAELQRKSLEGQKNAVNLDIKYQRENTKQLIQAIKEEGRIELLEEQLNKILASLDQNNTIISQIPFNISQGSQTIPPTEVNKENDAITRTNHWETLEESNGSNSQEMNTFYESSSFNEEFNNANNVNIENNESEKTDMILNQLLLEGLLSTETVNVQEESSIQESFDSVYESTSSLDNVSNDDISFEIKASNEELNVEINAIETSIDSSILETPLSENRFEDDKKTAEPEPESAGVSAVLPLYDDPNKALTADEIAKLFASFGQ